MTPQQMEEIASLAKTQAKKVFTKVPLLGAVTWLLMQQTATRHTLISELEWRVMPALVLDQAKLYIREEAPVAYASWAFLSEESSLRFRTTPHHLTSTDWKSGDQIWLVDVVAPFGGTQDLINDLRGNVFHGKAIHQLLPVGEGPSKVLTWPAMQKAVAK